ncbi:MAG: hypothetical protein ABII02_01855 [Candidatus Magasanikbacteria bacterium]
MTKEFPAEERYGLISHEKINNFHTI